MIAHRARRSVSTRNRTTRASSFRRDIQLARALKSSLEIKRLFSQNVSSHRPLSPLEPDARRLGAASRFHPHSAMRATVSRVVAHASSSIVRYRWISSRSSPPRRSLATPFASSSESWRDVNSLDGALDASDAPYVTIARVARSAVGALSDILLSMGASSVSTTDADRGTASEEEIFSSNTFVEAASDAARARVWARCDLTAYFDTKEHAVEAVRSAEMILGVKLDAAHDVARSNDWVEAVKESFSPIEVASGLNIVPNWVSDVDESAVNIMLEPGIAFGTGEHPTTRLCLRWLKKTISQRARTELVVDFGCGSGVLAIGALLLGAERAVGVDLARQAVQSSMDNAKLNGVEHRLSTFLGDGTDPGTPGANGQADVVIANILIQPVLELEPLFARYCKTGGEVALSGVLHGEQSASVVAKYSTHFDNLSVDEEGGWACVHGTRNAVPA